VKPARVRVETASSAYDVVIGTGLLVDVGALLAEVTPPHKAALLCDDTVGELFGAVVGAQMARRGFEVFPLSFPAGESSKNWNTAGEILESLAASGLGRADLVVALGGGVVGDLAGFAAATYLRGVAFAQIPTTLLAQVDSSVGGKTGVDLRAGKNLAGAFKQPLVVVADTSVLQSLPDSEWASGLAEVAKSAVIDSEDFLVWLERSVEGLRTRDVAVVAEAVRRSVAFKARVVSADEQEHGERECLNYGHTFGHALETVAGYGTFPHGLAVAEGMRFALRLAVEVAGAPIELVKRQDALLDALGLPFIEQDFDTAALLGAMRSDKKARGGSVRFVLPTAAGEWRCEPVEESTIIEHLDAWLASKAHDETDPADA